MYEYQGCDKIYPIRAPFAIPLALIHPENPAKPPDWGAVKKYAIIVPRLSKYGRKTPLPMATKGISIEVGFLRSLCHLS